MFDLEAHVETLRSRIGRRNGPLSMAVEKGAVAKFARAIGETNPLHFDEAYARTTRFGGLIAPPTFVSIWVIPLAEPLYDADIPGMLASHNSDVAKTYEPIRVGDVLTGVATCASVQLHRGRSGPLVFQTIEVGLTNQHDRRVADVTFVVVNHLGGAAA